MAREALEEQTYTENNITVLQVQVGDMGDKLRTVQSLASQTLRDSTDAYNQAINIVQQALSLQIPEVDHETLEEQAVKISREGRRIQEEARRLIDENQELLRDVQDRRVQLEDLLRRSENQQQMVDSQLAEMDGSRARALEAVEKGNTVLSDAQNTLITLQGT